MTNQPPPEELFTAERPVRSDFARLPSYRIRRVATCAVLAALIAGIGYGVYAWKRTPAEIPTIKAEGSLKQKPEQPGGIDIPNQDVLAYQQIDNSGAKPAVEHLLPPPEVPQPAAAATPAPAPVPPPAAKVENLMPPAATPIATTAKQNPKSAAPAVSQAGLAPAPNAAPLAPVEHVAMNDATPSAAAPPSAPSAAVPPPSSPLAPAASAAEPAPVPAPVTTTPSAPADKSAHAPAATGKKHVRVQLASFEDLDTARHQMAHMEKKYAGALGAAKLHLTKADLGPRGIYYRVQSNPLPEGDAHDVCAAIKKLKAGCILVKP